MTQVTSKCFHIIMEPFLSVRARMAISKGLSRHPSDAVTLYTQCRDHFQNEGGKSRIVKVWGDNQICSRWKCAICGGLGHASTENDSCNMCILPGTTHSVWLLFLGYSKHCVA